MTDIMWRILNIVDRVRNMSYVSEAMIFIFAVIAAFGVTNCIFGYRLLRFWMMLFGFILGAALGFVGVYTYGAGDKSMYVGAMLILGIVLALIAFLIYKVGIFVIGAGIGLVLSIYVIHPTASSWFFLCILIGIGLGMAAMRWVREIIIVGTSLLGGILAGFSIAKIAGLEQIPYGIGMSILCAIFGMMIQFAINKPDEEEEDEEEYNTKSRKITKNDYDDDYDLEDDYYDEFYESDYREKEVRKKEARKKKQKNSSESPKQKKTEQNIVHEETREIDYKLDFDKALTRQLEEECHQELKVEIMKEMNRKQRKNHG